MRSSRAAASCKSDHTSGSDCPRDKLETSDSSKCASSSSFTRSPEAMESGRWSGRAVERILGSCTMLPHRPDAEKRWGTNRVSRLSLTWEPHFFKGSVNPSITTREHLRARTPERGFIEGWAYLELGDHRLVRVSYIG